MSIEKKQEELNIQDLDLNEVEVTTEDDSYALPEAGASVGYNSCSSVKLK